MSHTFTPSLAGKVVVITGASSGLGEATARHLAARGAKLVLAARRTDKLQSLATELSAAGAEVLTQATDVTHMEQVQALADATLKRFGRIDVLVNNAGIMPLAPLAKLKVDEWSRMIDVNIKGVLHGIAAVLPTMTTQGDGHIINVASVAGHGCSPPSAPCTAPPSLRCVFCLKACVLRRPPACAPPSSPPVRWSPSSNSAAAMPTMLQV